MIGVEPVDLAFLGLLIVSSLVGLLRGFFREAISLAAWVAGIWVAAGHGRALAPYLAGVLANEQLQVWGARVLLLILILFAGAIASRLLAALLRGTGLGGADRVSGMLFGLARGVLLAAVAVIALRAAGFDQEPWWQRSKLVPYALPVADALRDMAEQGLKRSRSPVP